MDSQPSPSKRGSWRSAHRARVHYLRRHLKRQGLLHAELRRWREISLAGAP
jgi:hypothetical protein